MALTQLYADKYGVVSYDRERRLVQVCWLKHCSGAELRNVLSIALHCATANQLTAWLCDMRQLYYIEIADLNWMLQNLFPYFDMQKQHRVALLVNKSNFDLVATIPSENESAFNSGFGSFIDMIYFLDKDAAEQWLLL